MGVSESSVFNWEAGTRTMSKGTQEDLAAIFAALGAGLDPPAPRQYLSRYKRKTAERIPVVLSFIRRYANIRHSMPTSEEIKRGVGFPVNSVLRAMTREGLITRDKSRRGNPRHRSIRLTGKGQ